MTTEISHTAEPHLFTVNALADSEPAFTRGGLRHLIFHKGPELEAAGCVIRFGAKIMIDKAKLLDWLRAGHGRRVSA